MMEITLPTVVGEPPANAGLDTPISPSTETSVATPSTLNTDMSVETRDKIDKPVDIPSTLSSQSLHLTKSFDVANLTSPVPATNGPTTVPPMRMSPAPLAAPPVPNGKPTMPYVERSNPMSINGQASAQTVSSKDPKAAAQAASDMRNVVRRKLTGYVGFANLPNQWHRKSVRKGFNFNVMVVGT